MTRDQMHEGVARLLREAGQGDRDAAEDAEDARDAEDVEDKRWEALTFGTADEDEVRELRAEAESSSAAEQRWQLYRPLDSRAKEGLLERVKRELSADAGERGANAAASETAAGSETAGSDLSRAGEKSRGAGPETPETGEEPTEGVLDSGDAEADGDEEEAETAPKTLPFPARSGPRRRPWWLLPSVAAVAAVLAWLVVWPRPSTLPGYALTASSVDQTLRGASPSVDGLLTLSPDESFEIILRPDVAVEERLATAAFASRRDALEPVELETEVSPTGSVRLEGRFDASLRAGFDEIDLVLVVASRGVLPSAAELAAQLDAQGEAASVDPSLRVLRCRLRLERESEP